MKKIDKYLIESVKDADKGIIDMLNLFAQNSSGVSQKLYKQKINDANSVDVVQLSEVFNDDEIEEIKKRIHPQPKCCYENAWKLCDRFEYEGNMKSNIVKDILI